MLFTVFTAAFAWDLSAATDWNAEANDAAIRPGEALIALTTYNDLSIRDPLTNTVLHTHQRGGFSVAWLPDGSGLVECAVGGTYFLPYDAEGFGEEVELSPVSCGVAHAAANRVLISLFGEFFEADAAGLIPTNITGPSDPLLATRGDDVLIAAPFATTATLYSEGASSTLDFGIELRSLAGYANGWFGGAPTSLSYLEDGAPPISFDLEGGGLVSGDLDGDGLMDVLISQPEGSWVYESLSDGLRFLDIPIAGRAHIGSTTEDCGSVVWTNSDYYWHDPIACHGDADGDGATSEQGDCDDSDPSRHPSAEELCDAIDDNCDGDLYAGLPIPDDITVEIPEGQTYFLTNPICMDAVGDVEVAPPCWLSYPDVVCDGVDDGELNTTVSFANNSFAIHVTVVNVAPEFLRDRVLFSPNTSSSLQLEIYDPGLQDTHTFELVEGPSWVSLSADGLLSADTPSLQREHDLLLAVADDDGARTEIDFVIDVGYSNQNGGGGCDSDVSCSVGGLAPAGILGWFAMLLVRRRRSHD